MAYALAPSLVAYRTEVNRRWPQRDKTSDGWIGDTSHQARPSDHNPGARDLVHAYDTDEDLDGATGDTGADAWPIVAQIIANRDPRVKYIIYEGRIISGHLGPAAWQWRTYTGTNAHRHHIHLSILSTPEAEQDTSPWLAPKDGGTIPKPIPVQEDDVYSIVQADDGTPHVWLVHGNTRLHFTDQHYVDRFVWAVETNAYAASVGKQVIHAGKNPDGITGVKAVKWPAETVNALTNLGQIPPS